MNTDLAIATKDHRVLGATYREPNCILKQASVTGYKLYFYRAGKQKQYFANSHH